MDANAVLVFFLLAGILHGKQYMALGSPQNEVDSVRHARDLPGLMGFEAEVKRAASRRRSKVHTNPKPPGGVFDTTHFLFKCN